MSESLAPQRTIGASTPDPTETESSRPGLELLIGSNKFRNTNGVVRIQGKEQLFLESKPDQGLLLVTIDLYGETGTHIGHLRRNVLVLNPTNQFSVDVHRADAGATADLPWVRVTDQSTGQTVLEACVVAHKKIQVALGKFYSHKGMLVDITPHYCRIGSGTTLFGDVSENKGGTVVLG